MPNLDGTGPMGKGKLTGRQMGKCAGAKSMSGIGRGMGRGMGRNRFGFCRMYGNNLKDYKKMLEEELKAVDDEIKNEK